MALVLFKIGNALALVEKPEPPMCSVPQCRGEHWTNCDYPVKRNGWAATCNAKLCEEHVVTLQVQAGEIEACPAHARFSRRQP